jgi:hypothetical protein
MRPPATAWGFRSPAFGCILRSARPHDLGPNISSGPGTSPIPVQPGDPNFTRADRNRTGPNSVLGSARVRTGHVSGLGSDLSRTEVISSPGSDQTRTEPTSSLGPDKFPEQLPRTVNSGQTEVSILRSDFDQPAPIGHRLLNLGFTISDSTSRFRTGYSVVPQTSDS